MMPPISNPEPAPQSTHNSLAPIALFVYNRPSHTQQTIEALQLNDLASQSDLYIFSDAAKNEGALSKIKAVRTLISTVKGFKSVTIVEQADNLGLATSVINGVTRLCKEFDRVIVLEDDLVTSPHFLRYMNEALEEYQDEQQVISIHGYVYPVQGQLPDTFFLQGADCWGWATWKRGWDLFEPDGNKLLTQLQKERQAYDFNFDGSYNYIRMLSDQTKGKNSSWAVRWYASAFLLGKLTLYPGRSLVANIGNDNSGTHSSPTRKFAVETASLPIAVGGVAIQESSHARKLFVDYFRRTKPSLLERAKGRAYRYLKGW